MLLLCDLNVDPDTHVTSCEAACAACREDPLRAACQSAATLQAHSVIVCSDQTHPSMCFWTLN